MVVYAYRDTNDNTTKAITENGELLLCFASPGTVQDSRLKVSKELRPKYDSIIWIGWNDVRSFNPLRRALSIYNSKRNK